MEKKNGKILQLNTTIDKTLEYYLKFTKPINKLTDKEIEIVVLLLISYYIYTSKGLSREQAWEKTFDYDNKIRLMEKLKMDYQVFMNHLTRLRKKKAVIHKEVNPSYNPITNMKSNVFELRFIFNIKQNAK